MRRSRYPAVLTCLIAGLPLRAADPAPAAAAAAPAPLKLTLVEYQWRRGDPPVRMIRRDEGFCYLSHVQGKFAGGGESVGVYLDEADGHWYLGGSAAQDVIASAIAVRYPAKIDATVLRAPTARALADLALFEKADRKPVRDAAAEELRDGLPDPQAAAARGRAWLALAEDEKTALRGTMVAHAIDLLRGAATSAGGGASEAGDELARKATALADEQAAAFAATHLGDLAHWATLNGKWDADPENRISGRGDSNARFRAALPADGELSFRLVVLEGMRPRIHFEGTDLYVGNEGYERLLAVHGAQAQQGANHPYKNGDEIAVAVRFDGPNFECRVNGQLLSRGTRKRVPPTMTLRISGGDDWSPGTCLFWGFAFKPAAPAASKRP